MGLMETLGPTAFKLILNIGMILVIVVIAAVGFFGSRFIFSQKKRKANYKIKGIVFHPDGSFNEVKLGKFKGKDNIDKMMFMHKTKWFFGIPMWTELKTETMPVIDPKYIRSLCVGLWRYGVGQYAVIPPRVWEKMKPEDFKIEVINMQMKNFAFLEQRAAVSRWAAMKDALAKWAPFITFIILGITTGVVCYFMLQFYAGAIADITAARVAECSSILGGGSVPVA